MPFPWKKNRVTRISQIVADLQSPKHGGSLVVETGFPTSLIDLFVKNRNRFKKIRFKKPVHSEIPDPPPPPPSPATTPPLITEPLIPDDPPAESPRPSPLIGENADGGAAIPGRVGFWSRSVANAIIVKTLLLAVLVASVKGLSVGITVSAFALLFVEYAGKRVVSYRRPCSDASVAMEPLFRRAFSCVLFQKLLFQLKAKEECETEPATVHGGGVELSLKSSNIDEIEVVETKSEVGICCELDSLGGDVAWGFDSSKGKVEEPLLSCEVSECKIRGSRSGRFKSKMVKKLVPNKFRASKKEKREKGSKQNEAESGSEVSSTAVGEDKLPSFEIEEVLEDVGKEEEESMNNRSSSLLKNELEVDCGITCYQESALAGEVAVRNEKKVGRVGNSGYTILLIIALAGLLVGRVPALVLTIVWCFSVKRVRALWRSLNVPPIKCSVPSS